MNPRKKKSYRKKKRTVARHRAPNRKATFRKNRRATRRSNPHRAAYRKRAAGRVAHHRRRHMSRNPFGVQWSDLGIDMVFLFGSGTLTRSIPQIVAASYNTGVGGYIMNLLTVLGLTFGVSKFAPKRAAPTLYGGAGFLFSRIVDDFLHVQIAQFAQVNPGQTPLLSGDVGYGVGLSGAFRKLDFAVPSQSFYPSGSAPALAALPAAGATSAAAALPAASSPTKMQGNWGRSW